MSKEPNNLNIQEAIEFMELELKYMEAEDRGQLEGMTADSAFEMGYRVAIADLKTCTSPKPKGSK